MLRADQPILVTGATGRQGGAVVRRGVQSDFGYSDEVQLGMNLAAAARAANVGHLVYSSVAHADRMTGLRNYSKYEIEQHIRSMNVPATFLRPVWFMENFADPLFGLQTGAFALPVRPDLCMQLVGVIDIARIAELVFQMPEHYIGKTVNIAADAMTPPQIAEAISHAVGRAIPFVEIPLETLRVKSPGAFKVFEFMNKDPEAVDIARARSLMPGFFDFERWLGATGKQQIEQLLAG